MVPASAAESIGERVSFSRADACARLGSAETYWRCGLVDGVTKGAVSRLVATEGGAELGVRDGRLTPGPGYDSAPRETRQQLARVGAMLRLRARARYHAHAAGVVAPDGRAWLLTGESGSGKSTLTYVLARRGWPVLGDDGVVLECGATGLFVNAWREPIQVSIELARWFPELRERASLTNWADPRHRVPVGASFVRRAPIAGLIVLRRGSQDVLAPLAPTAALAMLVRQSNFLMVTDGHALAHLMALQTLVASVPCYALEHTTAQLDEFPATMLAVAA